MKLVSKLSFIANQAPIAASLALHETAMFIITLIRLFAPVDTGWLRDSYQKESVSQTHILIGTYVLYAIHQEFGTSRQSGTPHLIPAFLQAEGFFKAEFAKRMQNLG